MGPFKYTPAQVLALHCTTAEQKDLECFVIKMFVIVDPVFPFIGLEALRNRKKWKNLSVTFRFFNLFEIFCDFPDFSKLSIRQA